MAEHEQNQRRAAQIEAALGVLGWDAGSVDDYGNDIDQLAARLVDAVNSAGRDDQAEELARLRALVGEEGQPGWDGCDRAEAIRQANTYHAELIQWIDRHDARRDERDAARRDRDQAEARGYQRAIDNARDDAKFNAWSGGMALVYARHRLADYLEAVGRVDSSPKEDAGDS